MHKFSIMILALCLFVTSMAVVYVRHQHRLEYIRLAKESDERDDLTIEWNTLMTAKATWSSQERVEAMAKGSLGMHVPHADEMVSVK